ncbi:MAG TPA: hypothetical protein PLV42_07145 [bacterium]|nr:hypothetical protein [bacterium]
MKYGGALLLACLLLASCATMKNADTRPTEGSCMTTYDSGRIGEKEVLAGNILLPVGSGIFGSGFPLMMIVGMARHSPDQGFAKPTGLFIGSTIMTAVGGMAIVAGIVTLVDGHRRVNNWNDYCVGSTAAERYCLFEPLPTPRGETP